VIARQNRAPVVCYLIPLDAEMFGDDRLNPLANITHRFPTFLSSETKCNTPADLISAG
jgi:hypothetical protein